MFKLFLFVNRPSVFIIQRLRSLTTKAVPHLKTRDGPSAYRLRRRAYLRMFQHFNMNRLLMSGALECLYELEFLQKFTVLGNI